MAWQVEMIRRRAAAGLVPFLRFCWDEFPPRDPRSIRPSQWPDSDDLEGTQRLRKMALVTFHPDRNIRFCNKEDRGDGWLSFCTEICSHLNVAS